MLRGTNIQVNCRLHVLYVGVNWNGECFYPWKWSRCLAVVFWQGCYQCSLPQSWSKWWICWNFCTFSWKNPPGLSFQLSSSEMPFFFILCCKASDPKFWFNTTSHWFVICLVWCLFVLQIDLAKFGGEILCQVKLIHTFVCVPGFADNNLVF